MSGGVEDNLAEAVIERLRSLELELRREGIAQMSLFGSVARGEAHADSDVDLAVVLDKAARVSLIGLAGLELHLGEVLGRPVELLTLPIKNPWIRASVERDIRHVF
jgi:predicted nucleotidyltransferase